MNENHQKLCGSPEWAAHLQNDVLPAVTRDVDLGAHLLEVGPGPGAATEWLRHRVTSLVAVELDETAAGRLRATYAGTNVEIRTADATRLDYPDTSFDSAASFTMLHHVPTAALQNRLLAEVLRVLRPGGVLIGADSLPSDGLHHFHEDDTYNPIDPGTFIGRLQTLGYDHITVTVADRLTFTAHRPTEA